MRLILKNPNKKVQNEQKKRNIAILYIAWYFIT